MRLQKSMLLIFLMKLAFEQVARGGISSYKQLYRHTIYFPSIKTFDTMSNSDHGRKCRKKSMASVLLPSRRTGASSPREQLQWVGMTPLEWIESLSRSPSTQAQEYHRGDRPMTSDLFGNKGLAGETAASPSWTNSQLQPDAFFFSQAERKPETTKCTIAGSHEENVPDVTKSSTMLAASCVVSSLCSGGFLQGAVPLFWDLSPLQPCLLVSRIRCLILTVESRPNFVSLKLPYERTRDHFVYSFARIGNNAPPIDEMHLEKLYQEVISKLQALIDLSNKLAIQDEVEPHGCASPKLAVGKQDLTKYMTNWLRDNWANPYPDEVTLQKLAEECGSSPTVVGNWLINARTRKWRPAIVKAYDMNRPAALLLEDSINIFSGRPVHEIGFFEEMGPPTKRSRNI
jgi:hypothetical protein